MSASQMTLDPTMARAIRPDRRPRAPALNVAIYMHDLTGGGAERVTLALMRCFVASGVRVTLLLHTDHGELRHLVPGGVRVIGLDTYRTAADLVPLMRFLRRERPDILLCNLHHNNLLALLAKGLSRSRTKVVICQHNALSSEIAPPANWKYRSLPAAYRSLLGLTAGIVAVSQGVAADFAKVCHVAPARITTIYNPVLDDDFKVKLQAEPAHPWFYDDIPVFVAAGRLVTQKDHATLLRAFASYTATHRARLFIMGVGEEHNALLRLAGQLGISRDVTFAGFIENPLPYIRDSAAFVLSSRFEGFGVAVVEALGCGTPVISTDCPYGPAEILDNGRYGRLVPVGDPAALAAAMAADLHTAFPRRVLRARAAEFSDTASADTYLDLFQSLCPRSIPA